MAQSSPPARSPAALLCLTLMASAAMLGSPSPVTAVAGPWQENEQARVRLVSPWAEAPRTDELRLGLEFELRPGWRVYWKNYWKNSGDAGFPPVLDLSRTTQVSDWELLWPASERYELRGGLVAFGYHDHVIYPVRVRLDEEALQGRNSSSDSPLLHAFVAGLLLVLTPPLLVLFGLRFLASGGLALSGIRRGALASVVGTLVGFGALALVARGLDLATWGAQLQEPVLVTLLALANLALAFLAWGLLGLSSSEDSERTERDPVRPELPGLASGLLTAFLALGWSVPGLSFEPAVMLAAGLGVSVPYLLVVAAPVLAPGFRRLAGRYRLKEGLGFLALVGLVWLLYLLTGLVTPEDLALIELMLLVLGLLAWGRTVVESRALSWLLGLLLLAGAFYVLSLAP